MDILLQMYLSAYDWLSLMKYKYQGYCVEDMDKKDKNTS